MMQWMRERDAESARGARSPEVKAQADFVEFFANHAETITLLGSDFLKRGESCDIDTAKALAGAQSVVESDVDMLLTLACAWMLGVSPELATWRSVRKVANHSWQVENWLSEAVLAYAHCNVDMRLAYVDLAQKLFHGVESGEVKSDSERNNQTWQGALEHWQEAEYPIEEIWLNRVYCDSMIFAQEGKFFGCLSEMNPEVFLQLLAESRNPFLVDVALSYSGVEVFTCWASYVKAAPESFQSDGCWMGFPLLPLLLTYARRELSEIGHFTHRYGIDTNADATAEIEQRRFQIGEVIQEVVAALVSRADAPAIVARWSPWLMADVLRLAERNGSDIRSTAFVNNALIEELGKALHGRSLIQDVSKDAAPWEAWCYRCVLSSFADDGWVDAPSFASFADQWGLTPENWYANGDVGRTLLARAKFCDGDETPGLFATLLVLPLVNQEGFSRAWQVLWDRAYYLREVIEFGSVDAEAEKYSDQTDASRLLLLLARMGLACFDQVASRLTEPADQIKNELRDLHKALTLAVTGVLQIDHTINQEKWQKLLLHVAVRRACHDNRNFVESRVALFDKGQEPTVQSHLDYFRMEPDHLVQFLHTCMLNGISVAMLREALESAAIDVQACLAVLKRLNTFWDGRYPIGEQAMAALAPLME